MGFRVLPFDHLVVCEQVAVFDRVETQRFGLGGLWLEHLFELVVLLLLERPDLPYLPLDAFKLLFLFSLVVDGFLLELHFESFRVPGALGLNSLHHFLPLYQLPLLLYLQQLDLLALVRILLLVSLNQWLNHEQYFVEFGIGS